MGAEPTATARLKEMDPTDATPSAAEQPEVEPFDPESSDGSPSTPPAVRKVGGWARRLLIVAVVVAAAGSLYIANSIAITGSDAAPDHRIVVNQFPLPNAAEPRQTEVRAELISGYEGNLTVNGVPIPEDQLEGSIDPDSVSPEELRRYGIRPNNRNRVSFKPGPGKAVESLPQGEVTVTVSWSKDRQPGVETGSFTWTFTVN